MSPRLSAALLLSAVAAAWYAAGPAPTPAAGPTVSAAYAHDNLAVFVVRGPDQFDAARVLTLGEALEQGLAVVHETGDVNNLAVENLSDDHELFLQSGDIVKGGKQDRLVSRDMLLPPKSGKVACPANCCEQSRWTQRGKEEAGKFAQCTDFAIGNSIKLANAGGQQRAVWANVAATQAALSMNVGKAVTENASPTSLQLALEDDALRAKLAGYVDALGRVPDAYPDAVGVVVAVNGQVIAADVYGSRSLFRKVWPRLLRSAAADAVAQWTKDGPNTAAPAVRDAERFLASAAGETADPAPPAVADASRLLNRRNPALADVQALHLDVAQQQAVNLTADEVRTLTANANTAVPQVAVFGRAGARPLGGQLPVPPQRVDVLAEAVGGDQPRPAEAAGVVVLESRAPSQPSAVVRRSYLKK